MNRLATLAAVCAVAVLAAGCGAGSDSAAEVAGIEYAADDLDDYLAAADPESEARVSREDTAQWLSTWVFFTAVELELAERGFVITNAQEADAVAWLTSQESPLPGFVPGEPGGAVQIRQAAVSRAASEWVSREVPDVVGAQALRFLCSRHILVATAAEAADVTARLDAGEEFAELALELSLDTGSASLGGDLSCVVEGAFVAAFEDAAYGAGAGEVVTAESQYGFHVIEVISAGLPTAQNHPQLDAARLDAMAADGAAASFEQAQAQVQTERQELLNDLQQSVFDSYASQVRIDERYGYWDPDQFLVVPDPVG